MERLKEDIVAIRRGVEETFDQLIRQEAIDRIQPGESNAPLLEVLSSAVGMDTGPIKKLLGDFDSNIKQERVRREKVLREELRKKGVSGSAVIPNLNADEGWRITMSEAAQGFKEKLKSFS
jgi:hypothetical protein